MPTSDYFATSYREARQKFLAAADAARAPVTSRVLPDVRGPEDEELAMDLHDWARAIRREYWC